MSAHSWSRARASQRANALTRTRESPTERLFRGITWLLGNSIALPRRPAYFPLPCLFVLVCLSVCVSHVRTSRPLAFVPFCVCLSWIRACVTVSEVMWVDVNVNVPGGGVSEGRGQSPSCKSCLLLRRRSLWSCLLCTQYILQINFLSPCFHFLPLRNTVIPLCAMITTYCTSFHPAAHLFVWSKNKIGFGSYITLPCIPSFQATLISVISRFFSWAKRSLSVEQGAALSGAEPTVIPVL